MVIYQEEGGVGRPADREPVLAQVLRERREQPHGPALLVLGRLDRPVRVGRALDQQRLLARVPEALRPQLAGANPGVGKQRNDQRVPLTSLWRAGAGSS
jgi:hypothetical protein